MSTEDAHFRLRLPHEMHQRIRERAIENNRSINAEIVYRLQTTLEMDDYEPGPNSHQEGDTMFSPEEILALKRLLATIKEAGK